MSNNLGNKQTMADNIMFYMNKNNKSRQDLCRDLGFKYTTLTGWLTAEKYPRIDKIEMMANYFGITKADLVEERPATTNDGGLSPKRKAFYEKVSQLDDPQLEAIDRIVDEVLRSREK